MTTQDLKDVDEFVINCINKDELNDYASYEDKVHNLFNMDSDYEVENYVDDFVNNINYKVLWEMYQHNQESMTDINGDTYVCNNPTKIMNLYMYFKSQEWLNENHPDEN
mgnify:CR=1 FL=1|tara:strand:+ start:392 stop:718 length:327 start_codon:yes stop_codon:yes gene_type:complete